jgi:DMSO/TMAO reductase YedYZ heme-binding membrane subunit
MSTTTWWYLARASGYVAWVLVTASVLTGLVFATRFTNRRATPAWVLDLHRFVGGTAVVFTFLHLGGLVADRYVHFRIAELLVPFASSWKPAPVALGVVALYLLLAVEVTSLLVRRLPRRVWRAVHLTSYGLFWVATFHLLTAGTDAGNPVSRVGAALAMASVLFLTLVRVLADRPVRARGATVRRPPSNPSAEPRPAGERAAPGPSTDEPVPDGARQPS